MKKDFNNFRFEGLKHRETSNKYFTMNRLNDSESRIVVRVSDEHLKQTKFGYALILDQKNVVFIKDWQVSQNFYGNEVLLTKDFWNVKQWGDHTDFMGINEENHKFDTWMNAAKSQELADTKVKWAKTSEIRF